MLRRIAADRHLIPQQLNDVFLTLTTPSHIPVAWEFRHATFRRDDPDGARKIERRSVKQLNQDKLQHRAKAAEHSATHLDSLSGISPYSGNMFEAPFASPQMPMSNPRDPRVPTAIPSINPIPHSFAIPAASSDIPRQTLHPLEGQRSARDFFGNYSQSVEPMQRIGTSPDSGYSPHRTYAATPNATHSMQYNLGQRSPHLPQETTSAESVANQSSINLAPMTGYQSRSPYMGANIPLPAGRHEQQSLQPNQPVFFADSSTMAGRQFGDQTNFQTIPAPQTHVSALPGVVSNYWPSGQLHCFQHETAFSSC